MDEERIVRFLSGEAGRPLTVAELGEALKVPRPERRALRAALDRLVAGGRVIRIKGGRFALPSRVHLVTGTIQITSLGDGFVRPETEGEEVRVPAAQLGGAMDSDTVVVRVERQPFKGRKAGGRVIRIVKRARKEVVAFYEEDDGLGTAQDRPGHSHSA
jgi:ribonuclease R